MHAKYSTLWIFWGLAYVHWGSFTSSSKSVRRAIWFTWFSEPHDTTSLHDVLARCPSVYGTWQSQAVTHPIMNRARRCLTSVIEPTPMRQCRIPYALRHLNYAKCPRLSVSRIFLDFNFFCVLYYFDFIANSDSRSPYLATYYNPIMQFMSCGT